MYGQFHTFQSSHAKNFSITKKNQKNLTGKAANKKQVIVFLSILLVVCLASTSSFAGPKQPKLAGGNGNANGR